MCLGGARSRPNSDRMLAKERGLESARKHFAVHVIWHRYPEQVEKGRSEIDELCVFDLCRTFQCRPTADEDSVNPVRAAPFAFFRWTMLTNHNGRFRPISSKTRSRRKEAVFAPPVEDEVGAFTGKWAMKNFVASVNAGDNRIAGARIFQLPQFPNDKVGQRAILLWLHNASAFDPF